MARQHDKKSQTETSSLTATSPASCLPDHLKCKTTRPPSPHNLSHQYKTYVARTLHGLVSPAQLLPFPQPITHLRALSTEIPAALKTYSNNGTKPTTTINVDLPPTVPIYVPFLRLSIWPLQWGLHLFFGPAILSNRQAFLYLGTPRQELCRWTILQCTERISALYKSGRLLDNRHQVFCTMPMTPTVKWTQPPPQPGPFFQILDGLHMPLLP